MIEIKVKKSWQGMVAIRDKYLNQAKQEHKSILIQCEGGEMIIAYEDLDKYVMMSDKPVIDYFTNTGHYLVYYKWTPVPQATLKIWANHHQK